MSIITDLPDLVAALPADRRARFERIFRVDVVTGRVRIPATMREWAAKQLGPIDEIERQHVVRVTNLITWDGALFNPLRGKRPMQHRPSTHAPQPAQDDIFADPISNTAEDVFGRIRGQRCIISSNVSRWEGQNAVCIFDEFDPLKFDRELLRDVFATSLEWARRAHEADPLARYFVWGWNGGLKAGASVPHAHTQMGLGRHLHYGRIEGLRRAALAYAAQYGTNYFDDLQAAHDDVGLNITAAGVRGFEYLAANRSKDTWLFGRALDQTLADALHDTLRALIDKSGTGAFNVLLIMPPLFPAAGDGAEDWRGFPVILRVCDRGAPSLVSSDVGMIDIYAHNVISVDPFVVKQQIGLN